MSRSLTIDQKAFIAGEEGVCPECEKKVAWSDLDKNWYMCASCVDDIVNGGADVRESIRRSGRAGTTSFSLDTPKDLIGTIGNQ